MRRQLRGVLTQVVVVAALAASTVAYAADNYIRGSTWADPNSWTLHLPPANGDNTFITGASPSGLAFLFDYNYASLWLGGLTVDNTGGGSMVLSVPAN